MAKNMNNTNKNKATSNTNNMNNANKSAASNSKNSTNSSNRNAADKNAADKTILNQNIVIKKSPPCRKLRSYRSFLFSCEKLISIQENKPIAAYTNNKRKGMRMMLSIDTISAEELDVYVADRMPLL